MQDSYYFQYSEDDEVTRRFNWARGEDEKDWERLRNARSLPSKNSSGTFDAIVCSYTKKAGGMESQVVIRVDDQAVDEGAMSK